MDLDLNKHKFNDIRQTTINTAKSLMPESLTEVDIAIETLKRL
jgi:hypothetical protein